MNLMIKRPLSRQLLQNVERKMQFSVDRTSSALIERTLPGRKILANLLKRAWDRQNSATKFIDIGTLTSLSGSSLNGIN